MPLDDALWPPPGATPNRNPYRLNILRSTSTGPHTSVKRKKVNKPSSKHVDPAQNPLRALQAPALDLLEQEKEEEEKEEGWGPSRL